MPWQVAGASERSNGQVLTGRHRGPQDDRDGGQVAEGRSLAADALPVSPLGAFRGAVRVYPFLWGRPPGVEVRGTQALRTLVLTRRGSQHTLMPK